MTLLALNPYYSETIFASVIIVYRMGALNLQDLKMKLQKRTKPRRITRMSKRLPKQLLHGQLYQKLNDTLEAGGRDSKTCYVSTSMLVTCEIDYTKWKTDSRHIHVEGELLQGSESKSIVQQRRKACQLSSDECCAGKNRLQIQVAVQTYRVLHADAPLNLRQLRALLTSRLEKTSVLYHRQYVCSCRKTIYCWTSRLSCRWWTYIE